MQADHHFKEVKSEPSRADAQVCTEILEDSKSQSSGSDVNTQAVHSDGKSHVETAGPI